MIELCCGTARLSRAFHDQGMRAVGIDHKYNKHVTEALVLSMDLSCAEGQQLAWAWIKHPSVKVITMAPPCGTASRARERPDGPPPLRSDAHPQGLPNLSPVDQARVDKANAVYLFCSEVAEYCTQQGILWFVENPENSIMWQLPIFKVLLVHPVVFDVCYDACMFGGIRKKSQRLRTNIVNLSTMALRCDNSHDHAPWRSQEHGLLKYHTADEAEYPYLFCEKLAAVTIVPLASTCSKVVDRRAVELKSRLAASRRKNAAAAGKQSRTMSSQLVEEFAAIKYIQANSLHATLVHKWFMFKKKPDDLFPELPHTARIMDIRPMKWGEWEDESDPKSRFGRAKRALAIIHSQHPYVIKFGIPWEKGSLCREGLGLHASALGFGDGDGFGQLGGDVPDPDTGHRQDQS